MVGSMKLLIASLCLRQVSGEKKLHGNLRAESRNVKAKNIENQRDLQVFAFEDNDESKYDDYFVMPEEVENSGNVGPDDYFTHTSSGMVYNWNYATDGHTGGGPGIGVGVGDGNGNGNGNGNGDDDALNIKRWKVFHRYLCTSPKSFEVTGSPLP
mmetsp:Transcript_2238/g.4110  ORF Transcript_2238/g.4110 Transcript_2238/m.4110 type:complete len:155 (-) Transcript_2238:1858-2322(-)